LTESCNGAEQGKKAFKRVAAQNHCHLPKTLQRKLRRKKAIGRRRAIGNDQLIQAGAREAKTDR
jgi:hypothetical protein